MLVCTRRSGCEGAWLSAATDAPDAALRRHRNGMGLQCCLINGGGRNRSALSANDGLIRPACKCRAGRCSVAVCQCNAVHCVGINVIMATKVHKIERNTKLIPFIFIAEME